MITESKIDRIQKRIRKLLKEVAKDENINFRISTFDDSSISFNNNILFTLNQDIQDNYNEQKNICVSVGLPQNIIGMRFTSGNDIMTIIDIEPKNKKYKVILEDEKENLFHMSIEQVIKCLGGVNMINRNANLKQLVK